MDKPIKQISRRDAMKLLGAAAGATVLANLPSKWQTPQLAAGVLPAHAQTSAPLHTIVACETAPGGPPNGPQADGSLLGAGPVSMTPPLLITSGVLIASPDLGVSMHYKWVLTNLSTSDPLEGDVPTGAIPLVGVALVTIGVTIDDSPVSADVTWTFTSPADGSGSCHAGFEEEPV